MAKEMLKRFVRIFAEGAEGWVHLFHFVWQFLGVNYSIKQFVMKESCSGGTWDYMMNWKYFFPSQEYNRGSNWCVCCVLKGEPLMIITSFQYNLEVIEWSLKFSSTYRLWNKIFNFLERFFPFARRQENRRAVLIRKMLSLELSIWRKALPWKLISSGLNYPNPINSTI